MASTTTYDARLPSVTTTTANVSHNLPMLSYNSTGWNTFKADFINTILLTHGIMICALQEHFKLKDNLNELNCFNNYEVFSIPATYKDSNTLHLGRPSGGISLIYSHSLCQFTTRLVCPGSHRVQGLKVDCPESSFLFINTYFPNDSNNK